MHLMRMVTIVTWLFLPVVGQVTSLRVVSAAPTGELTSIDDASQVRIVFSEPMVALGAPSTNEPPPWLEISPRASGTFYWTGTRTLTFSPGRSSPLPFSTKFTVRITTAATSTSGQTLSSPYELTFTTPTPRLVHTEGRRKEGRFDAPVVLELWFNQPMDAATVLPHLQISLRPHLWVPPPHSSNVPRGFRRPIDQQGRRRYTEKVVEGSRVARASDRLAVRASTASARRPPSGEARHLVMLETTTAPPQGSMLDVHLAATLRGLEGPETHKEQSAVIPLGEPFFVTGTDCQRNCNPQGGVFLHFPVPVSGEALVAALTVTDVTDPSKPRRLERSTDARFEYPGAGTTVSLSALGFNISKPARTWQLDVAASLQSDDGQTLGYPWVGFVETGHAAPFLAFEGGVLEATGETMLPVTARNYRSVFTDFGAIAEGEIMPRLIELEGQRPFGGARRRAQQPLTLEPDKIQAHGLDLRSVLSSRGTGLVSFFLEPRAPLPRSMRPGDRWPGFTGSTRAIVQVTNLGITLKRSVPSTGIFVTRLDSGAPVPGARVSIVNRSNHTLWRGTTDEGGAALAPAVTLPIERSTDGASFVVSVEKDGDVAFVKSGWEEDIYDVDGDDHDRFTSGWQAMSFTDRGVYRPNEEIHIKTIVREQGPDGLRMLPADTRVEGVLTNAEGQAVETRVLTLNEWGSAEWTWRVPASVRLGPLAISVNRLGPDVQNKTVVSVDRVLIAEYRRPEFIVNAQISAEPPILGSTLRGTVDARYLFGAPLGSRPVDVSVHREPVQRPPTAITERFRSDRYVVGYLPQRRASTPSDTPIQEKRTLGADGRLGVDVVAAPNADEPGAAYEYRVDGLVEDVSHQFIAGNASMVVHPASIYVIVERPPFFVETSKGANLRVAVADLSGQPVAAVPVHVSLTREQWVPPPPDRTNDEWVRQEIPAGEWTVQASTAETRVPISITEGGSYRLRATARDASGRLTRTEAAFYGLGPGQSRWGADDERLEITPERKTWKPGERARVLMKSPWPRATAFVTLEREGVRRHQTVAVTSTQDTVELPITEADVPNLFVSVTLVKGRTSAWSPQEPDDPGKPAFRVGYAEIVVDDPSKHLQVVVDADHAAYRPRDVATVTASVTGRDGAAAHAEVTLWAMDRGVLSVTDYKTPALRQAMYTPRPLGVRTIDSRRFLVSRALLSVPPGVEGGILGGEALNVSRVMAMDAGESLEQPTDVRQDLRPLAFWLGSAITDSDGRVTTTVTLPDLLTTYRIMAVAGDRASRFGSGEREIRVTKPLTLLPAFPRFLNAGDRASFGAVLTSTSAQGPASIRIESRDPERLRIEGAASHTVALEPGVSVPIRFDAVAAGPGPARVRIVATQSGTSDAFEVPLDIAMPARVHTTAAYGETTDKAVEALALPSNLRRDVGGLSVDLSSTALVGLSEPARYLAEYPYSCAEQRTSRALALLLAAELGDAFALPNIKPAEYRAEAANALRALTRFQCGTGGFALWEGQCGTEYAYLTAYILHVLKAGAPLQFGDVRQVTDPALDYLEGQLKEASASNLWWPVWAASQAYSLKVLAEYGRKPGPELDRLLREVERLPIVAQSYVADALAASNDRGPRYRDLVRRLGNAIRIEADRAHVEERDETALGWLWTSNARSTAVVLEGFARRQDEATLAAPLVRWLTAARTNGRWQTTHENATALEAFVAYYRTFERTPSTLTATVGIGTHTVGTATFAPGSSSSQRVTVSMDDLVKHVSATTSSPALSIEREGSGRLYYTARVQYAAPEPLTALDRGFAVERRYEPYVERGKSTPQTSFNVGDVVRVVLTVTVRGEARYLALSDPLPSGFESIDEALSTTAMSLARDATTVNASDRPFFWWRRGGFDHVEKRDDRFLAFATSLGSGTHEIAYLVRATTAGTFAALGARVEAMYAPELEGRSAAATVTVRPK